MANLRPLVIQNGEPQRLQVGDVLVDANNNPYFSSASLTTNFVPVYNGTDLVDSRIVDDGILITITTAEFEVGDVTASGHNTLISLDDDNRLIQILTPLGTLTIGDSDVGTNFAFLSVDATGVNSQLFLNARQTVFIGDTVGGNNNTLITVDDERARIRLTATDSITITGVTTNTSLILVDDDVNGIQGKSIQLIIFGDIDSSATGATISVDGTNDNIILSATNIRFVGSNFLSDGLLVITSNVIGRTVTPTITSLTVNTATSGLVSINTTTAINTYATRLLLENTSAATSSGPRYSPGLSFIGRGWKSNTTAASQPVEFHVYLKPILGLANPSGQLVIESQVNAGGFTTRLTLDTAGILTVSSLYAGDATNPIQIIPFAGQDSWLNMPTAHASGIGSNGAGQNAWVAYAAGGGNWFADSGAGDICYRNATTKKLRFGIDNGTGNANTVFYVDTARVVYNKPVTLTTYTVAALPAGNNGDTAMVSDALAPTFGAAVVGGGAVKIPVYYDGAWKVG